MMATQDSGITEDAMACYRVFFPFFSFLHFHCNMQHAARKLRQRRRRFECTLFATVVKSLRSGVQFCKIKAFYSNRMYSHERSEKNGGSRSQRGLFLLEVFFFAPLWTQPFVSSVACESSLSIDEKKR